MKELKLEKISPIDKDNIVVDDYSILVESKRNIRNYYLLPDSLRENFSIFPTKTITDKRVEFSKHYNSYIEDKNTGKISKEINYLHTSYKIY